MTQFQLNVPSRIAESLVRGEKAKKKVFSPLINCFAVTSFYQNVKQKKIISSTFLSLRVCTCGVT